MKIDKLKTYIGFAIRSGKCIFGYDKLFICKKNPDLVLICSSLNDKIIEKIHKFCNDNSIKYIDLKDVTVGEIVGRENCKCFAVCDCNLSEAIMNEYELLNGKVNLS